MSLIFSQSLVAAGGSLSVRIEKAIQHVDVERISPWSVVRDGLLAGLPEVISAEITHPVRDRVRPANDVDCAAIALFAQHGRGPITETMTIDPNTGVVMFTTRFKLYLNDLGPIEVLADDHFILSIAETVNNSTYNIYAPELPLVPAQANKYFEYEADLVLKTDRERRISAAGKVGIILPNLPTIKRVLMRSNTADGNKTEQELTVFELMAVQSEVNPFIATMQYKGANLAGSQTLMLPSGDAELFLVMFNEVESIQLDVELGTEFKYTTIALADRV